MIYQKTHIEVIYMEFDFDPFIRWAAKSTHIINRKYVIARDCRLLYILSGCGTLEINGHSYTLSADDLFYYPYGIPYRITSEKENGLLFYIVNFDFNQNFSNLKNTMPLCDERSFDCSSQLNSLSEEMSTYFLHTLHMEKALWAKYDLDTICNEHRYRNIGYRQIQSARLKCLLISIYRNQYETAKNSLCHNIKDLVNKDLSLNTKDLADILNYHPYYLNELFKKNEGVTLHKYVLQQRLAKAYNLVASTTLSFEEIASICGFCSQSHFSSKFKEHYHITPLHLRRLM